MCELYLYIHCMPKEGIQSHARRLWGPMRLLGIQVGPALNHRAISLAPVHTFNPNLQEVGAGYLFAYKASRGCTVRPSLRKENQQQKPLTLLFHITILENWLQVEWVQSWVDCGFTGSLYTNPSLVQSSLHAPFTLWYPLVLFLLHPKKASSGCLLVGQTQPLLDKMLSTT